MTTQYSRNILKVVVAQICQTIGWHSIHSTPLEFMVDLMQEYIFQIAKSSHQYAQIRKFLYSIFFYKLLKFKFYKY